VFRITTWFIGLSILTESQIQVSVNVKTLLDTTADCLRFVTEFFEVISKSVPHIYHSALVLAPQSSIIWRLYNQQIDSVARVVTGIAASWDSCTASVGTTGTFSCAGWSPCGQFIAASLGSTIEVRDSNTLERVSVLKPPSHLLGYFPGLIDFSPDGHLLGCSYNR